MIPRPVVLGGAVSAVVGAMLVATALTGGEDSVYRSDADLFRRVALDPFGDGSAIDDPGLYGDAYRYGRVLFPLSAWVLGLGNAEAVEVGLVVLTAVAFGAVAGLSAAHVELAGGRAADGLIVLLAPGLWLAGVATFSEPFVLALLLAGLLLQLRGRTGWAAVSFAGALLAREAVLVAILPAVVWDWRARGGRALARLAAMVAPLAGWWIWVRFQVGSWPILDDSVSRRDALAPPLTGVLDAEAGDGGALLVAVVIGGLTLAAAIALVVHAPRSLLAWTALAAAVVIPFFGPNVWRYAGEAVRTMAYPQVLVLLGVAVARAGRTAEAATP